MKFCLLLAPVKIKLSKPFVPTKDFPFTLGRLSSRKRVHDEVRGRHLQVLELPLEGVDGVDWVVLAGDAGDLPVGDLGLEGAIAAAAQLLLLLLLLAVALSALLLLLASERNVERLNCNRLVTERFMYLFPLV